MDLRNQQTKDANANVIVAMFSSYGEADEALRDLQARGLRCDDGQLYARAAHHRTDARPVGPLPEMRARDRAEYVGHGEHLGVVSGRDGLADRIGNSPLPILLQSNTR